MIKNNKTTYYSIAFFCFVLFFVIFCHFLYIHYFDLYPPYLEDAESNGICLNFYNPWESGSDSATLVYTGQPESQTPGGTKCLIWTYGQSLYV